MYFLTDKMTASLSAILKESLHLPRDTMIKYLKGLLEVNNYSAIATAMFLMPPNLSMLRAWRSYRASELYTVI